LEECMVIFDTGVVLGKVERVDVLPSNENLIVRCGKKVTGKRDTASKVFYVPLIKDYIKEIDIARRKIILKNIPEYI
jgi:ribosomal 30S subunit maturation factor RimM